MAPVLFRRLTTAAPDAALLARFVAGRDEASFAELVRRHGPAVYRVCRRLVGPHADDAFQATFLILATRAGAVRKPGAVGGWLVGVAGRVARQMRKASHRRTLMEQASGGVEPRRPELHPVETADLARVLDEELTRLPDRLRGPAVLCLVEGRTQEQAAADLGGSVRTVRRRLDEARSLLRLRLERRGVVPAVAAGLVAAAGDGLATVPAGLVAATTGVAFDFLAGGARCVPAAVIAKGVTMTLFARKLVAGLVAAAVGLVGLGVGLADDGAKPPPAEAATIPPQKLTPAPTPPPSTPTAKPGPAAFVSQNFQVYAPTREAAVAVADAAERHRKRLADEWLGRELPPWPKPCPVTVEIKPDQSGGASTFSFGEETGKPEMKSLEIRLFGPWPKVLDANLPHEVMHCVLATYFGRAVPRWADEGLAVMAEPEAEQHSHDLRCRELLNHGRGIQLGTLFKMTEYPKDMIVVFAQGYAVGRFLLGREPKLLDDMMTEIKPVIGVRWDRELARRQFLLGFIGEGMTEGWDRAAKKVYGFESVDKLQEAWLQWLQRKPAAAPVTSLAPPPLSPTASGRLSGFVVEGQPSAVERAIRNELTLQRQLIARKWVGGVPAELARPVRVSYRSPVPMANAHSYLNTAGTDRQEPESISLYGPLDRVLERDIKMVLVKGVYTERFGVPPPDWAITGLMACEAQPADHQALDTAARALVSGGQAVKLAAFFEDAVWHTMDTQNQGYSVIRFLLSRPVAGTGKETPEHALTDFLSRHRTLGWDGVCQQVYGFKGVDDLEAQWLAWLKTPASKLVADPPAAPPAPPPTPRIPATKLDGR